jgi:hypothetical protein
MVDTVSGKGNWENTACSATVGELCRRALAAGAYLVVRGQSGSCSARLHGGRLHGGGRAYSHAAANSNMEVVCVLAALLRRRGV